MSNNDELYKYVNACASQVRKSDKVTTRKTGNVQVTEIFAMPSRDEIEAAADLQFVDLHFIEIAVNKQLADQGRALFIDWCDSYPRPDRLAEGPSYIELGGVLGDQGFALMVMAVGKILGLWSILIPKMFGIEGAEADQMAGVGHVMISGYR